MQKGKLLTLCLLGILVPSVISHVSGTSDIAFVAKVGDSKSYVVSKLKYNGTNSEPMEIQLINGTFITSTVTEGDSYTVTIDSINATSVYAECNYTYGEYSTIPWYCHEVEPVTSNTTYWNERIKTDALWDVESTLVGNTYKQYSISNYTEGNDKVFSEYKYEFDITTGWVTLSYYKNYYENGTVIYEHEVKPGTGSGSAFGFEASFAIFAFVTIFIFSKRKK